MPLRNIIVVFVTPSLFLLMPATCVPAWATAPGRRRSGAVPWLVAMPRSVVVPRVRCGVFSCGSCSAGGLCSTTVAIGHGICAIALASSNCADSAGLPPPAPPLITGGRGTLLCCGVPRCATTRRRSRCHGSELTGFAGGCSRRLRYQCKRLVLPKRRLMQSESRDF